MSPRHAPRPFFWGPLALLLAAGLGWGALNPAHGQEADAFPTWEYRVVGLTEIHGNTLEALQEAFAGGGGEKGGILELARRADENLAQRTEEFLDSLGAEGWELIERGVKTMVFKRRAR